jgi:hypothetical protein
MQFSFSMPSKGGGITDVQIGVRPADFPMLLEIMCIVDRQTAMQAMSRELSRQIAAQPKIDKESKQNAAYAAAYEMVERARGKYDVTMVGEDQRQLTFRDAVRELVYELELE